MTTVPHDLASSPSPTSAKAPYDPVEPRDVFLSYSRKAEHDRDFALWLQRSLEEKGHSVWLDRRDIEPTSEWWKEICEAIDRAANFLFVISPDSVEPSSYCLKELERALQGGKKLIPVVCRPVKDSALPEVIRPLQYLGLDDRAHRDGELDRLIEAIRKDLPHARMHAELGRLAGRWRETGGDPSRLLRGKALDDAEAWLRQQGLEPLATSLHIEWIGKSRRAEKTRQRTLLASVSSALLVTIILLIVTVQLFRQAQKSAEEARSALLRETQALEAEKRASEKARKEEENAKRQQSLAEARARTAEARELALRSRQALVRQPDLSLLLAARSLQVEENSASLGAAVGALQLSEPMLRFLFVPGRSPRKGIVDVRFYDRDRKLVGLTEDGSLITWDLASGRIDSQRQALPSEEAPLSGAGFALSTSERQVLVGSTDGRFVRCPLAGGHCRPLAVHDPDGAAYCVGSDPAFKVLFWCSGNGTVRKADLEIGEVRETGLGGQIPENQRFHHMGITTIAVDDSGRILAAGTADGQVTVLDLVTGDPVNLWKQANCTSDLSQNRRGCGVLALAVSTGGKIFAAFGDGTVRRWELHSGNLEGKLLRPEGVPAGSLALDPRAEQLALGLSDGRVEWWLLEEGTLLRTTEAFHTGGVTAVVYSADGERLVSSSRDGTVAVWGCPRRGSSDDGWDAGQVVTSLAFAPQGHRLAAGMVSGEVRVWSLKSPQAPPQTYQVSDSNISSLILTAEGTVRAGADFRGLFECLKAGCKQKTPAKVEGKVGHISLSSGSESSVILSTSREVMVCSGENCRKLNTGLSTIRAFVRHDVSGRVAVGGGRGEVVLCSPECRLLPILPGDSNWIGALAFTPDGTLLAVGTGEGLIYIYDVAAGRWKAEPLNGHQAGAGITALVFRWDGRLLASGARDGGVLLWDVTTRQSLGEGFRPPEQLLQVSALALTADGKMLAAAYTGGEIRLRPLGVEALMSRLCRLAGRNLTEGEWDRSVGGNRCEAVCPQYDSCRDWLPRLLSAR